MAYAALVFLDQQLEQLLPQECEYLHLYKKDEMESLHSNVIFLQKFLEDFPRKSSVIKQLESEITDVAYGASSIISRGISDDNRQFGFESCMRRVCGIVGDATEIRKVLEMQDMYRHDSWSPKLGSPSTCSKHTMVGFETDFVKTKERIVGRDPALQIIPITGMGGIGKTTLAKNVYEDPPIVARFDFRFWVTVSHEHNAQKILKEILGDTKRGKDEPLIVGVHKMLSGRRFLIVMDDIWSAEAWDSVRNAFPDSNKGSRIIITTRLTEVATKVGSSSPLHEMQLMNEIQSWELFQKEALGEKEHCPYPLEKVGKIISKNCAGLPLAIVVIARLLKLNYKQTYWEGFARNMNEAMAGVTQDNQVMEILSLSYDNLPPHLKACFLYTIMFPEDENIPTEKLKQLWVAEGLLKPTRDTSIEELAEKCLVDLIERNLLSGSRRRSGGGFNTCTVHDLLRDLSLRKAKEDKFSQQIINTGNTTSATWKSFQKHMPWFKGHKNSQVVVFRRCAGIVYDLAAILRLFGVISNTYVFVWSLVLSHGSRINDKDLLTMMTSELFRVMESLERPVTGSLSFGANLRYLSFYYSGDSDDFDATLANIRKLKNLETLTINHDQSYGFKIFPILEMPKLKHLDLNLSCSLVDNLSKSTPNKSLLKTLSGVYDFELRSDEITILVNLVKLKMWYPEGITDRFGLNNLVYLHQLENLNLRSRFYCKLSIDIAFPDRLKKITLRHFRISWEIMSAMGSLPNLQVLKLDDCRFENDEWETVEGEFQQLKYLKLGVVNLEEWKVESNHFPCLEQLNLVGCYLKLPIEVAEIESLHILVIAYYNKRTRDSATKIQEEQQKYGNDQLQLIFVNQTGEKVED